MLLGKFLGIVAAIGGIMMFAFYRRNGRKIRWNKIWNRSMNMMSTRNMRFLMKRGRRMMQRWT